MIALVLMLAVAGAEMLAGAEASAALSTITETATMNAHITAVAMRVDREMTDLKVLCCMRNATCKTELESMKAGILLHRYPSAYDVEVAESEITALLDTALAAFWLLPKSLPASVSLAIESRSRIDLDQVRFYFEVRDAALYSEDRAAAYSEGRELPENYGEVWSLRM